MYDLTLIVPEMIEMTDVVCDAVAAVHTMCEKFTHYKKSHSINSYIIAIDNCEDRADRVYIRSVHHILKAAKEKNTPQSNIEANGITATLAALERCCDACEGSGLHGRDRHHEELLGPRAAPNVPRGLVTNMLRNGRGFRGNCATISTCRTPHKGYAVRDGGRCGGTGRRAGFRFQGVGRPVKVRVLSPAPLE